MDFGEFVAVVAAPKEPVLEDFERIAVFAHSAEKAWLWQAMAHAGIHPVYRALLAQALQRRIVEEHELERARCAPPEDGQQPEHPAEEPSRPRRRRH